MLKIVLTLAVAGSALALAGCASQPAGEKTAQQENTHMVCFSTKPLGSHIAKTHCMTATNYAAYKKAQEKQGEKDRAKLQKAQQRGGGIGGGG